MMEGCRLKNEHIKINCTYPPPHNFSPEREKEKKGKKEKDSCLLRSGLGIKARFFSKILPERSEVWRFWRKPVGLDLADPKTRLIFAAFLFFGKNCSI